MSELSGLRRQLADKQKPALDDVESDTIVSRIRRRHGNLDELIRKNFGVQLPISSAPPSSSLPQIPSASSASNGGATTTSTSTITGNTLGRTNSIRSVTTAQQSSAPPLPLTSGSAFGALQQQHQQMLSINQQNSLPPLAPTTSTTASATTSTATTMINGSSSASLPPPPPLLATTSSSAAVTSPVLGPAPKPPTRGNNSNNINSQNNPRPPASVSDIPSKRWDSSDDDISGSTSLQRHNSGSGVSSSARSAGQNTAATSALGTHRNSLPRLDEASRNGSESPASLLARSDSSASSQTPTVRTERSMSLIGSGAAAAAAAGIPPPPLPPVPVSTAATASSTRAPQRTSSMISSSASVRNSQQQQQAGGQQPPGAQQQQSSPQTSSSYTIPANIAQLLSQAKQEESRNLLGSRQGQRRPVSNQAAGGGNAMTSSSRSSSIRGGANSTGTTSNDSNSNNNSSVLSNSNNSNSNNNSNHPVFIYGVPTPQQLEEWRQVPINQSPMAKTLLREPMLPPPLPHLADRVTLVLDIDETLLHASFDLRKPYNTRLMVEVDGESGVIGVAYRPQLDRFLSEVCRMFEIVIFTASHHQYANQLMDAIDPQKHLGKHRLCRDKCTETKAGRIKDLCLLGRPLERVAIIDNTPVAYAFQRRNAIPIESWFGNPRDRALTQLLPMLRELATCKSVYDVLDPFNAALLY